MGIDAVVGDMSRCECSLIKDCRLFGVLEGGGPGSTVLIQLTEHERKSLVYH